MNTMLKRIVSMFLCLVLVAGYLPAGALAAETEETVVTAAAEATTEPSAVETAEETAAETTEETEPEKPGKPAGPKGPGKHEKPGKPEPVKPEAPKPEQETVPETTEATVPVTEETVPETTEATVPATEETVPETTEETEPVMMMMAAPRATAPEHVDAAIFFSDLHTNKSDYKESTVKGIMNGLNSSGLKFSSVTSCGDAFSVNEDNSWSNGPYTGYTSTITGYIQDVFADIPVNYVWSDHDRYAVQEDGTTLLDNDSGFIYGAGADGEYGTADDGNYYIYELSMADMSTYNRYNADFHSDEEVTATIAAFVEDAAKLDQTKPLFIASHQPLLDRRDDNGHALEWATAINTVAENMDVAFFFGHNHKYDKSGDYYYAKGSTMSVCKDQNGNAQDVKLNFTHLCTGYLAPASTKSTSDTTRQGTAMAVTIFEDSISYVTYDKNGVYTGSYALNVTVDRDHAEAEDPGNSGETPEVNVPVADENNTGITVAAPGVTAVAVTVNENPDYDSTVYTAYASYDINLEGYNQGDVATVTVPAPASFDANLPVVVLDNGVKIATTKIVDGKITFTTNHFSVYDVAQVAAAGDVTLDPTKWEEVIPATGGTTTYTYTQADSIKAGQKYVIVANGNAVALMDNNGSMGRQDVTISGNTMTSTNAALTEWTFSDEETGTIYNGTRYLRYDNGFKLGDNAVSLTFADNDSTFAISYYSYYRSNGTQRGYYYLCYADNTWKASAKNTAKYVRLYQFADRNTVGGTGATYAQVVGPTSYQVSLGTSAAAALQEVKDGITGYHTTDRNAATGEAYQDNELTWTMADNYDPKVAGTYTVTISYNDVKLAEATVEVVARTAKSVILDKYEGTVERDSAADAATGAYLTVTWEDDTTEQVPVTLGMLSGSYNVKKNGTYSGLSFSYGGRDFTNFTLKVVNKTGVDDFPLYPNPGSVDLKKSAEGVDFQNTGIARVELSASGLPYAKGIDVIVMLDLSSSMDRCIEHDTKNHAGCKSSTRMEALEASLELFETELKKSPNKDNIKVAIADFNVFYTSGPVAYDSKDYIEDYFDQSGTNKIYTSSTNSINAGAFIPVSSLDVSSYTFSSNKGTNYDYAFDTIYQLGSAIRAYNKENNQEDRELVVLFMSDGAANQFNFYRSEGGNEDEKATYGWNYWLDGTMTAEQLRTKLNSTTHSYYFDSVDHDGDGHYNEHRMANAIKGDPSKTYEVIRKSASVAGNVTLASGSKNDLFLAPGLGATMYAIAFDIAHDGEITDEAIFASLEQIPTSSDYYVNAASEDDLKEAFNQFASDIANAAESARFVDQMGDSFNLQMNPTILTNNENSDGTTNTNTTIQITSHPVYTKEQVGTTVNGHLVTTNDIGKPYGNGTILETVSFTADDQTGKISATTSVGGYKLPNGTTVTANSTNILVGDVIYGKNFFYNNNNAAVTVTLANGSSYSLPGETFYWNIGTIRETLYTISYTVYLEGSLDGDTDTTPAPGSYDTNNYATLYYTNHVGNEVNKSVPSPSLAWEGANVSYAFYLVNTEGKPVHADGTAANNFLQAHKLTQPVVYQSVKLNDDEGATLSAAAVAVLPEGYKLYANDATYKVVVGSGDGEGANESHWLITGDTNKTTYVVGYGGANDYSNVQSVNDTSYDYTHTTVYFAVVWTIGAVQDTVVIDYGLPVDINVMANDMFGSAGTLTAVGLRSEKPAVHTNNLDSDKFDASVSGTYGTAELNNGKVRYTLRDMQIHGAEKLAYAVNYTGAANAGYYYGDLTVIPATTIYYEDEFVTLKTYTRPDQETEYTEANGWPVNSVAASGTQAEDRPGSINLSTIDANNIYGYDQAYENMSTHSMGTAAMVHVDSNSYATATFSFYGTGFDVISLTSNMTGALAVQVYQGDTLVRNTLVDTYYGMEEDGTISPNTPNALYQVPVIRIFGLDYGNYDVKITATYNTMLDHTGGDPGYDLYLDAIRIYDPAGAGEEVLSSKTDADGEVTNTTITDIYAQDGEAWPEYYELRDMIIKAKTFNSLGANDQTAGIVFIDSNNQNSDVADYQNYGPNNELYLASGQAVAFHMALGNNNSKPGYVPVVRIGLKTVGGETAVAEMWNVIGNSATHYNAISDELKTATDMYYDITVLDNNTVVIKNSGKSGSILSITNVKLTYKPTTLVVSGNGEGDEGNGENQQPRMSFSVSRSTVNAALMSLAPVQEEIPEESVPETTVPEDTKPTEPVKPDNSDLKAAVEEAKKLKAKDYTKESFKTVETARKAAEKVLKDKKATQTRIDEALADLNEAVDALEAAAPKGKPGKKR